MAVCPNCGEDNPERAKFCLACATALSSRVPQTGAERKVVSVLFADLVGFTARSDGADPEDVQATLRLYHRQVKQEIDRFGGTVEKFVGDAVMAVFGAPVAHEDDAERAVRAALRITQAIEELNEKNPGLDLAVRAAVNTGEAVVTLKARPEEGEGIAMGDVVNTASRLQQVAPIGRVVVGEVTYRATKGLVDYEELEPVTVKGKGEPIPIWRAIAAASPFRVDVEQARLTPFIGREHELALLKQTYARTVAESGMQLITIIGEPGVGKTRLVSEIRAFVEDQPDLALWRQGRCLSYGEGITFWALGEVVKAEAGVLESDSPEAALDKLEAAVRKSVEEPSERDWFRTRLAPLVGVPVPEAAGVTERTESFTAWRRFLEAVADPQALVVVFEDLHWADPPMLEFVEHLVDWSTGVGLLVVCTARPELFESHPGWGGGKRNAATISLPPLTDEETARLISALLSQALLPAETQAVLLERAGGNPLYAEEFVRMLMDRGILVRRGRAVTIAPGAEIPVPESVQSLVAARLDTLPAGRKSLLHDAAVVGKVFWGGAVAAIGGIEERVVEEGMHELARKELVRASRTSSVKDQAEYSFWHLLVRDVAYGQIPRGARATKHRAAAGWIEEIAGDRVSDHAELLAYHYSQALHFAQASGASEEARQLEAPARRFLVMAGDRAMWLDIAKAETYYRRALELPTPGDPERGKVLAKAAEAAWLTGRFPEAERGYEEAIAELRAQGNALGVGDALVSLSFVHGFRGETARARALLDEVITLLEREPPGAELAHAYVQMARDHMLSGHTRECLEWSGKALALAEELGTEGIAVMARQFRGNARCELGDLGGLDDLQQALRMSLDLGLGHETVRCHINLSDWVWLTEGPARGLEIQRAGIDFGERRGITAPVLWTKGESQWTLFDLGEWDELLRIADELISWDRKHAGSYFGVMALSYKAWVLACRGDVGGAAPLQEEFLPRARKIGDPQILVPALAIAAIIEQSRGDLAAAVRLIEEFGEVTRDHANWRALHLPYALRVLIAAGMTDTAERLVPNESEVATARDRHCVSTGRALLAEARGDLERASGLYAEAAERWTEYGFALERGQTLLGAGRCLLALTRPGDAVGWLQMAREVFEQLRARPLVEETDAWLEQGAALSS